MTNIDNTMDIKEKYGFFDTDAFLSGDGHCWSMGIDLLKCERIDTGDRIELRYKDYDPCTGAYKEMTCKAKIYRLIYDEETFKYSEFPDDVVLYAAIIELDNGYTAVCDHNRFFKEAIDNLCKKKAEES